MCEEIFKSQKYFLFKLPDMLNNSNHVFEEKRLESLQLSLKLCIDTYKEMNSTPVGADKLDKSYKGLLSSLAFQLKKHPFYVLEQYKNDFDRICELICKDKYTKYELYTCIKTLQNKLQQDKISDEYIECLHRKMTNKEMDFLIEAFVSDLLYMGYSLTYLIEWYAENIKDDSFYQAVEAGDIEKYIEKIKNLNGETQEYQVIIPYQIHNISQREAAKSLLQKRFSIKTKKDFSEYEKEWYWKEEDYACKLYEAADYYKAIDLAQKEFSVEKELFSMCQNVTGIIRDNKQIGCIVQDKLYKIDIRKVDYTRLISYFDETHMKQLFSFVQLKDQMKNEDVDILERVLHTLHIAKTYNIQNRYLNFWSALEYVIYPFPKESIIEKARVLLSESFTLFYIKNKMNIFWKRLKYAMEKRDAAEKYPECTALVELIRENDGFNTKRFVEFLQDKESYKKVLEEICFHVILEREYRELIMLVTEPEKTKKVLEEYHDGIVHDLDCIYRLRNQLIHSAKRIDDSLEYFSLRLYKYVNSIVATILYYKRRNPSISIIEILNSVHHTYEVYMKQIKEMGKKTLSADDNKDIDRGYNLVRPHYLFLE